MVSMTEVGRAVGVWERGGVHTSDDAEGYREGEGEGVWGWVGRENHAF